MAQFKYKIVDKTNLIRTGLIEGNNIDEVSEILLDKGFTIVELKPAGMFLDELKKINIGGIPFAEKVVFIRQLAFMLNAGLPLTDALSIALNQIKNLEFRHKVESLKKDVESGIPLSQAMEKQGKLFDTVTKNLIKAGEESGKLDIIMERIADNLEKKQDFRNRVQGALIYPIIIIIAIIGVVVALLVFMVPEMSKLYADQGAELPLATQIIINTSNFLTSGPGGILLLFILLTLLGSLIYYRRTPSGRLVTDKLILKIPIFGELARKSQVAEFAMTLSMLINAGIPILDALKLVADSMTNVLFQIDILEARKKVEKGIPLSLPLLTSEAFPELLGHMVKVGEETGKLDEVILKVGTQYMKEVDYMVNNLTKLMEPVILILMGVVVGGLAIAVYLPIISLGNVITQ